MDSSLEQRREALENTPPGVRKHIFIGDVQLGAVLKEGEGPSNWTNGKGLVYSERSNDLKIRE